MRIDFEEIDREELPQTTARNSLSPSLTHSWKSPFSKDKEPLIAQTEEEQSLSFSVSYPYEISRSVSPAAVHKQIAYLQAKKILPASTLKFIQSAINSEMENKKNMEKSIVQSESSLGQIDEKPQLKMTMRSKEAFNWTLKKAQANLQNCQNSPKKSKKSRYNDVKPRVYDIKKPNPATPKNHQREAQQLDGLTLKPSLNYTMNSKVAKQVSKKRGNFFKTFNTTVFETLYNAAAVYSTKKQLDRLEANIESRCSLPRTSRIKVYSTFQERLQTSIQKQASRRKKAQNKLDVDPATGKKMFVPDTRKSKITYLTHFKSQSRIFQFDDVYEGITTHYEKDSSKLNHSQEMVSTLNNSCEKDLNKSLDSKYRVIRKPLPKENRLAELYADLLWEENRLNEQALDKQERQILDGFLYEVKNYQQNYSQNISKQVFIAFFKQIYLNMNLYDRAILEARLKKQKKEQPQPKFSQQMHSARHLTERKLTSSRSQLDHTSKHFFI